MAGEGRGGDVRVGRMFRGRRIGVVGIRVGFGGDPGAWAGVGEWIAPQAPEYLAYQQTKPALSGEWFPVVFPNPKCAQVGFRFEQSGPQKCGDYFDVPSPQRLTPYPARAVTTRSMPPPSLCVFPTVSPAAWNRSRTAPACV